MSIPLTINGAVFEYPVNFDENWGVDATGWAQAVTNGMLQMAGGSFPLTAEVDFGGSFGIKALYLKSRETNPASAGIVRLSSVSAGIAWRNNANTGNLVLTTDAADNLFFNGVPVGTPGTLTNSHIFVGNASNVQADVAMSGDVHITNAGVTTIQPGAVTDSKITGPISVANGGTGSSSFTPANPLFSYRRPCLVYSSGTVVSVETGLDGTSGDATILFPDGQLRSETSSTRYNMTISQNAVFTNATLGNNQGGLRTGTVSNNTWYALYAVKVTTFAANWVLVADTVTPVQANYATLNSNFGTNGWVYLGTIPYGDGAGVPAAIILFTMSGNRINIENNSGAGSEGGPGVKLASTASAASLVWTYASGTSIGSAQVPSNLTVGSFYFDNSSATSLLASGSAATPFYFLTTASASYSFIIENRTIAKGFRVTTVGGGNTGIAILLSSYIDNVLGVGSNPVL